MAVKSGRARESVSEYGHSNYNLFVYCVCVSIHKLIFFCLPTIVTVHLSDSI